MATNQYPNDPDALLSLVGRIKENYQEPPPSLPKRGKKRDFSALSFLLLAAVAVTLRTFSNSELRVRVGTSGSTESSLARSTVARSAIWPRSRARSYCE
jgi:hypothetical protein